MWDVFIKSVVGAFVLSECFICWSKLGFSSLDAFLWRRPSSCVRRLAHYVVLILLHTLSTMILARQSVFNSRFPQTAVGIYLRLIPMCIEIHIDTLRTLRNSNFGESSGDYRQRARPMRSIATTVCRVIVGRVPYLPVVGSMGWVLLVQSIDRLHRSCDFLVWSLCTSHMGCSQSIYVVA